MRGFRRKVAWILMERSGCVHLKAFLNLRHVRLDRNVVAKKQDCDDEQIDKV